MIKLKEESEEPGLKFNIQKTKIMASGPIISCQIDGETVETEADFIFLGSKITADDCSHEIKRCLLLGRKVMINLDSIFKRRDITLATKVHLVKAMAFPVVMYGYESWNIKKAERRRIDAFELCCWRRLLRVSWTARRSNQSILTETSPGCSLEGLMLTQWTCVWVDSGSWWWIGRPGMLRFMGSQRVGHDWVTELNWCQFYPCLIFHPWKVKRTMASSIFPRFLVINTLAVLISWHSLNIFQMTNISNLFTEKPFATGIWKAANLSPCPTPRNIFKTITSPEVVSKTPSSRQHTWWFLDSKWCIWGLFVFWLFTHSYFKNTQIAWVCFHLIITISESLQVLSTIWFAIITRKPVRLQDQRTVIKINTFMVFNADITTSAIKTGNQEGKDGTWYQEKAF